MRQHTSIQYRLAFLFAASTCLLTYSSAHATTSQAAPTKATTPAKPCDPKITGATVCAQRLYQSTSLAFLRTHNTAAATAGFQQVLKLDPKYAPALFNLGVLAEQRQAWSQAQSYFKQFLVVSPSSPDIARAAHEIAVLQPYVDGTATAATEKQAEYDASIARARILLGKQLYKEAISEAGHAQSLDDSRWEAYAVVSLTMFKQHKDAEGKDFADLALARTPPEKKDTVAKALVPQQ